MRFDAKPHVFDANRLGVSVRHVRRFVGEQHIPFYKWGYLRFDPDEVETLDRSAPQPRPLSPQMS